MSGTLASLAWLQCDNLFGVIYISNSFISGHFGACCIRAPSYPLQLDKSDEMCNFKAVVAGKQMHRSCSWRAL